MLYLLLSHNHGPILSRTEISTLGSREFDLTTKLEKKRTGLEPEVCLEMMVDCEAVEGRRVRQDVGEGVLDVAARPDLLRDGDERGQVGDVGRRHLELVFAAGSEKQNGNRQTSVWSAVCLNTRI